MYETDIHIVCSRNEAFGRSAVEAMLLGKPVIYTAAGAFPEYMIDGLTGLPYPPGDADALADRIASLMDHPEQRAALGNEARAHAMGKFTPDAFGGEFHRGLRKVLTENARSHRLTPRLKALMKSAQREYGRSAAATAFRDLLNRLDEWWKSPGRRRQRKRELEVIQASGLFDHSWYLRQYPDVAAAKIDPLHHYLEAGAREGRNPNPSFNTATYSRQQPEIVRKGINPFAHHILQTCRPPP